MSYNLSVYLSVLCPLLTWKWKDIQCSHVEERLPTSEVTGRADLRWKGQVQGHWKKRVEAYHVSHWVCTYLLCKWCTEWLCHKDFHAYWWKMQIGGSFKLQSYWCISWLSRISFFNKVNIINILCRQTCMVQTVVKKTLLFWQMQRELIGKIVQPNQLVWMFIKLVFVAFLLTRARSQNVITIGIECSITDEH